MSTTGSSFDFQAHQRQARRTSAMLVLAFVVMAAAISLAIGVAAALVLSPEAPDAAPGALRLDAGTVAGAAGVVLAVILGTALVRVASFGGDGAKVARALGAEEVTADSRNPYQQRYLNVVEEMAIAAGLPRPRTFVIKHEQGINAFAAGDDPTRAAIGVTHGALAKLDREELAGVLAHEMAHVANRDTRLNVRLMGMVFGLVALYVVGRGVMRSFMFMPRRRGGRTAAPAFALGLALVVLGFLGLIGGRILQSAVSRRRESLADASGVEFTRNPAGLARALKKIGATAAGSRVNNAHAEEARHMFFANAMATFGGLFATHPPLVERIRALEPHFDPATDPIWAKDDKALVRETRRALGLGPWDRPGGV